MCSHYPRTAAVALPGTDTGPGPFPGPELVPNLCLFALWGIEQKGL